MRTVRVRISGRVQGVFFRTSCARMAEDLGLVGWVRNLPGGDLEAVFQGADQGVEDVLAWCRKGPPHARVERVEVEEEPSVADTGFRIER
jgi:acylphosphatase